MQIAKMLGLPRQSINDWDLKVWDLNAVPAIAEPKRLSGHLGRPITSLVFSADDSRLAACALLQNTVLVWNITADASAAAPLSLPHGDDILAIALSPDGSRLAVANAYNLHLWNLAAADPRESPVVLPKSRQWVLAVAFSPDGHRLAAAGVDPPVRLWDLTAPDFASRPALLRGHTATR